MTFLDFVMFVIPQKIQDFWIKGKIEISVENPKFF